MEIYLCVWRLVQAIAIDQKVLTSEWNLVSVKLSVCTEEGIHLSKLKQVSRVYT